MGLRDSYVRQFAEMMVNFASKVTGGTTSNRGLVIGLCAMISICVVLGQIVHLADPDADEKRAAASASPPPPFPPPSPTVDATVPLPPAAPPLAPPPEAWWQRRLPHADEIMAAQWELLVVILLCVVLPLLAMLHRNWSRARRERREAAEGQAVTFHGHAPRRLGDIVPASPPGKSRTKKPSRFLELPELPMVPAPLDSPSPRGSGPVLP